MNFLPDLSPGETGLSPNLYAFTCGGNAERFLSLLLEEASSPTRGTGDAGEGPSATASGVAGASPATLGVTDEGGERRPSSDGGEMLSVFFIQSPVRVCGR